MTEHNPTIVPVSEIIHLSPNKRQPDIDVTSTESSAPTAHDGEWQPPIREPHMGLLSSCNMVCCIDHIEKNCWLLYIRNKC
jgi:hypothetical protein